MNLTNYIKQQLREAYKALPNQENIDYLLDKMNNHGWGGLTDNDRETLRNVGGGKSIPPVRKAGVMLMGWHKNPIVSPPTEKSDGTTVRGVKSKTNDLALGMIFHRPEGHITLSFNKSVWEFLRNAAEVTDKEVLIAIQQWAAKELALDIELQHISQVDYVLPRKIKF